MNKSKVVPNFVGMRVLIEPRWVAIVTRANHWKRAGIEIWNQMVAMSIRNFPNLAVGAWLLFFLITPYKLQIMYETLKWVTKTAYERFLAPAANANVAAVPQPAVLPQQQQQVIIKI